MRQWTKPRPVPAVKNDFAGTSRLLVQMALSLAYADFSSIEKLNRKIVNL